MACLRYRANLTRTRTRRVLQIFSLDFEYSILNLWSLASWEFKFRILSVGFMMQRLCLPVAGGVALQQRDSWKFICRYLTPKMLCAIFKVLAWRLKACCFTNLKLLWIEITNTSGTGQCPTLSQTAFWGKLFELVNLLASILASSTDLKRIQTPHKDFGADLCADFRNRYLGISEQIKPLQHIQVDQAAEPESSSLSPSLSPWLPAGHFPKTIPLDNQRFWLQSQWPSSWGSSWHSVRESD